MKLQPTAHETLQLSVNSQQVTKGLFTTGFYATAEADFDVDERVCMFTSERHLEDVCVQPVEIAISDERFRKIAEHTREDPFLSELKPLSSKDRLPSVAKYHRKCSHTITSGTSWGSKAK